MANEQNLVSFNERTASERRELARQAGIKSGQSRRARKTLKETLLLMLAENKTQENITLALLDKALKGDTKAYEVIRDTIGEKAPDKVSAEIGNKDNMAFKLDNISTEELKAIVREERENERT